MEHEIHTEVGGVLRDLRAAVGDAVWEGHVLALIEERDIEVSGDKQEAEIDLDAVRPDLAEVLERHRVTLDEARPDAIRKRRKTKQRTARENIDQLCDEGQLRRARSVGAHPRHRPPEGRDHPQVPDRRDGHRRRFDQRRSLP